MRMPSHEALFLLKSSFGIPRLQFLLRTAPCALSPEVFKFDESVRGLLSSILNLKLVNSAWVQASLPVRWGGIGIRRAEILAPSAFLASIHSSTPLVNSLMPELVTSLPDKVVDDVVVRWTALSGTVPLMGSDTCSQKPGTMASALQYPQVYLCRLVLSTRLVCGRPSLLARGPGCRHFHVPTWDYDLEMRNCVLQLGFGSGHPLFGHTVVHVVQRWSQMVITALPAVGALVDTGATPWPTTSSSVQSVP